MNLDFDIDLFNLPVQTGYLTDPPFLTFPMIAWPPSFIWTCSTRTNWCPPCRNRRRTSTCIVNTFIKRAAVDPNAAIRRSDPNALSSLLSTAIAAA
jgi:hypothetical protein